MRSRLALFALLVMVLAGCGAQAGQEVDAVAVTPVQPVPAPAGTAPDPSTAAPPAGVPLGSPYRSGAHGYDASFPQCGSGRKPRGAQFSIIGVNGGKSFTTNRCLAAQWRAAPAPRALYLNSGYYPANSGKTTAGCRAVSSRLQATDQERGAYALGCSAVVYSQRALASAGVGSPLMWWIDVERLNSWDTKNLSLNRYALQGQIDQLVATAKPIGVYSAPPDWREITGDWAPSGVDADWLAGVPAPTGCATPGFTGDPVWLVQEPALWPPPSDYDSDWAC
jgi:hypothetical protein